MTHMLIADDHPLVRLALLQAVRLAVPTAVVEEADSLAAARARLRAQPDTDLVLLDLHMPDSGGLIGLTSLRAEFPMVAVVMISAHDDAVTIRRALNFGAAGFIPKRSSVTELQAALRAVLDGNPWFPTALAEVRSGSNAHRGVATSDDRALAARLASLTPQQFRVLAQIGDGRLNKQIAADLGISERTVKAHVSVIFEKLGARNRTQAGLLLRQLDLADPSRRLDDD